MTEPVTSVYGEHRRSDRRSSLRPNMNDFIIQYFRHYLITSQSPFQFLTRQSLTMPAYFCGTNFTVSHPLMISTKTHGRVFPETEATSPKATADAGPLDRLPLRACDVSPQPFTAAQRGRASETQRLLRRLPRQCRRHGAPGLRHWRRFADLCGRANDDTVRCYCGAGRAGLPPSTSASAGSRYR